MTKVVMISGIALLIWSALFASTFRYPFHWDDLHSIRPYSAAELVSTFHGVVDPDQVETPGLRPFSPLVFNIQGTLFGENIVLHRIFMILLMWGLLIAVGTLLLELGINLVQIGAVFALFISSRVFASLVLWLSLSHILFAYVFIVLTAYFFVLWMKRERVVFFLLMLVCATVAAFTREESYTLPATLPLIWLIFSGTLKQWRRALTASVVIAVIVSFHYWLWHALIPDALSPKLNSTALRMLFIAIESSWLPGGHKMIGGDKAFGFLWIGFVLLLLVLFFTVSRRHVRWQFAGMFILVGLLCLPALGVARAFGIALPTLAAMTALSIAAAETNRQLQSRPAFVVLVYLAFAIGIGGGIRRSLYVAEALRPDCAVRVTRDAEFLFDLLGKPTTIPAVRRQAGLDRLASFGIGSAEDAEKLREDLKKYPGRFELPAQDRHLLFRPKYDYLSF